MTVLYFPNRFRRPYWERWEQRALSAGVEAELASLGRQVMMTWSEESGDTLLLGAETDGNLMLQLALNDPDEARQQFQSALRIIPGGERH